MNILVTGAWQGYSECRQKLIAMGHEIVFMQWEKDCLPVDYTWAEGVIGNGLFLSHPIDNFKNLRFIQLTSAGFDRVPMDYVEAHHIEIHNARGVYSIPMAEYAVGGVLQLFKHFNEFSEQQKRHEWNKIRKIRELHQSTVCILGCGSVGTECAKRFSAFGCKVLGVDICGQSKEHYDSIVSIDQLSYVLSRSDILVITLPLNAKTKGLISRKQLEVMKPGGLIVNIARGGIIDYPSLIEALTDGCIGGAVLDVFDEEPLASVNPLWDMKNVIITPHNSFVGEGNLSRLNQVILNNLKLIS